MSTQTSRTMASVSPYYLRGMIFDWNPPAKPHCSNCLHAKVGGTSDAPVVTCAQGRGKAKLLTLPMMIRSKHARQFEPATTCPEYSDMGPPTNVHRP